MCQPKPAPPRPIPVRTMARVPMSISVLGFGGTAIGNLYARTSDSDGEEAVQAALDAGITYFDTAPLYGHGLSERRLGSAIAGTQRDSVVISTKVGWLIKPKTNEAAFDGGVYQDTGGFTRVMDLTYDGVMRSVEESLQRLGLQSVDILYIHDIDRRNQGDAYEQKFKEAMSGAHKALITLREQGAVKGIGAGLNDWEACEQFAQAGDFDVFLLAGRFTLLDQGAHRTFLPLCKKRGISVVLGGPFNSGILAGGPVSGAMFDYAKADAAIVNRVQVIQARCREFGVNLASAALQFPLIHPSISSVVAGMRNKTEVESNVSGMTATIPIEFWLELQRLGLIQSEIEFAGQI